ncbi:DUF1643 domain-containing protein [Humidesulfovibrio mexicanus]|nr:DUF1643 domain-containing protein [Humidesulfovibrio mexicanus]
MSDKEASMLACFTPKEKAPEVHRSAIMAENDTRRYLLTRQWGYGWTVLFVGLNPSTANATHDDPTLRRLIGLARSWEGYGRLLVCNLFSLVSPDPKALLVHPDPVGPLNDFTIHTAVRESELVVAGWGAFRAARERAVQVLESGLLGSNVRCLGQNADGSPKHPLYLPRGVKPVPLEGV